MTSERKDKGQFWNPLMYDDGKDVLETVDFNHDVHSGKLRSGSSGNLLHAQSTQFGLQFIELLLELVFVLAPKLADPDLGGRLLQIISAFCTIQRRYIY